MSNMIGVAAVGAAVGLLFVLAWGGIAVAMLRRRGLLRLDVVLGRVRMAPEESPWILLAILLVAVSTGMVAGQMALTTWEVPEIWQIYVHSIVLSVVAVAAVLVGLKLLCADGLALAGLRWRDLGRSMIQGLLAMLALWPAVFVTGLIATEIAEAMGRPPQPHQLLTTLQQSRHWLEIAVLATMAIVLAPLLEELVFRGLLQTMLTRLLTGPAEEELAAGARVQGRWQSVLITSLLFAAIHGEPAFIPPLFVLSVGLGVAYERTGSLWMPIVMHGLFNGVQIVLAFLVMGDG